MRAQRQRARVLRLERLHQLRPDHARGAQLGDLHEVVHADRPEERHARRELVDRQTRLDAGAHIFDAVGERIGEFEILRRAGFLHVIAGDRNRIELRHLGGSVGEDVGDDADARRGRIDIGVAHHEFFEDVVLDRARQFRVRHALFFRRDDIERQHRKHRAVHGHRHAHLVERDAGEQRAHVVDRSRSPRPPCRRRRKRADGRCRNRDGWRDRRRWRGPSARRRGCAGRRRWNPPRWRSRHIAGWSRAAPRTSRDKVRAGMAPCRDRCRGNRARRDRLSP